MPESVAHPVLSIYLLACGIDLKMSRANILSLAAMLALSI